MTTRSWSYMAEQFNQSSGLNVQLQAYPEALAQGDRKMTQIVGPNNPSINQPRSSKFQETPSQHYLPHGSLEASLISEEEGSITTGLHNVFQERIPVRFAFTLFDPSRKWGASALNYYGLDNWGGVPLQFDLKKSDCLFRT